MKLIEHVRNACESREGTGTDAGATGFSSYPSGYPFLFWQQYIDLKYWLVLSLASVLATIFVILSLVLMNPYTALLVVSPIFSLSPSPIPAPPLHSRRRCAHLSNDVS